MNHSWSSLPMTTVVRTLSFQLAIGEPSMCLFVTLIQGASEIIFCIFQICCFFYCCDLFKWYFNWLCAVLVLENVLVKAVLYAEV